MADLAPYVVPPREAVEYPEVRVSHLTLTQQTVGGPVDTFYRIDRYRIGMDGPEDAPPAAAVSATGRLTLEQLVGEPELAKAVEIITAFAVRAAVRDGLLSPAG